MQLRTAVILLAAALVGAAGLTAYHGDTPLDERILRIETERALPDLADELRDQPADVRLAFLDYAGDDELVLSARLALLRHPQLAPRVLALYGPQETFRSVLREHGPAIIPPITYFLHHEPAALRLRARLAGNGGATPAAPATGPGAPPAPIASPAADDGVLSPFTRGAYAIEFIAEEGHDFLGQFVIDARGEVAWLQSERVATGVKRFFTSGLTGVESKWRRGEALGAGDYGWAAVDIMVPIALLRLARVGRAATGSARAAGGGRVAHSGLHLGRSARLIAIGGTAAGIGYVALNPGVLNSIGGALAERLGLPPWLVNAALWFVLLLPLLVLLRLAQRWLLRPTSRLLGLLIRGLLRLRRRLRATRAGAGPPAAPATAAARGTTTTTAAPSAT